MALPEVIEPEQPVEAVQAVPAPAGMVATANVAKTAQRAPSEVTVTVPTAAEATLNVSEKDGKPVMSSMTSLPSSTPPAPAREAAGTLSLHGEGS
jgi:hypothetical protein